VYGSRAILLLEEPTYPGCWAITGDPWYVGYKSPTVALEPSIEWVARAGRLTDGKMGTHDIVETVAGFRKNDYGA
jgi:hypothetical protein